LKLDDEVAILLSEIDRRKAAPKFDWKVIMDESYPEQNAFVLDNAKAITACCTRRAGKSTGLAHRFFRTMLKHPGCKVVYCSLTRDSAENIMWNILDEEQRRFGLKAEMIVSKLLVRLPNGSALRLYGADMKDFIPRLKGGKYAGVAIDEAQDFGNHLSKLVEDVFEPALIDYTDGWIALTGTPGPVLSGYFFETSEERKHGFSNHKWTLYSNPYLSNPREFVNKKMKEKGWDETNPTYLREYCAQWVYDASALVLHYSPSLNHFDQLPSSRYPWSYVLGIDIGHDDADAFSVIAFNKGEKAAYLIEEQVIPKQGITALAECIDRFEANYALDKIVMDYGGLGKKISVDFQDRFKQPVVAAEKSRKNEYLALLNDAMRIKRFFARQDSVFASDCNRLQWDWDKSTPDKLVISDKFHSDIIDSTLYAFRESLHWLFEPEPEKPKEGTQAWYRQEEERMIDIASRSKQQEDDPWGDWE
jgi:hypothetical protein